MDENGNSNALAWTAAIAGFSDIGLQWYSTVTQKPIAREQPASLMGLITGTDYGGQRAGSQITSPIGGGVIMVAVIAVIIVALVKR